MAKKITKSEIRKELTRIQKRAMDAKLYVSKGKPINWIQDELKDIKQIASNLEFELSSYYEEKVGEIY